MDNFQFPDEDFMCDKTVAILGGSFDPPTLAHVQLAAEIYNRHEDVNEVWIIPCGDGRGDKNLKTEGRHRLEMLNLIIRDILGENGPIMVRLF
jgi:nicotinic acid mononucleotide adenylyltransferase